MHSESGRWQISLTLSLSQLFHGLVLVAFFNNFLTKKIVGAITCDVLCRERFSYVEMEHLIYYYRSVYMIKTQ